MNQHYLQLYADFIVKVGVNVRPRQNFIVRCPVTMPDFAHACVRAGYEAGAKTVVVRWEDDKLTRLNMELADEKDLTAMKPYELRSYLDYAEDPDGCCTLAIHAEDPEALAGLDAGKLNRVNLARRTFMKPWQEYTMNARVQWCVAAVPAPGWAAKVFPELPLDEAVEKLWALIFDVCRVSTGDPVGAWQKHVAVTKARRDRMNALELDRIHMTSSNGTDLTVGLADDATWEGASSKTEDGIEFIANVPTEEVFCAPHRERTNGIVYGTKPYAYNGQLIEGWHVTFQNGKVVEHGAEKNAELLAELLDADVLVILTAVEQVAINFNKPDQKGLDDLTPAQAKVYMDENQFAKGSMLPKVQAAVKFAESKAGRSALITLLEKAKDGIEGKTGTRIHQ
mgnify:CR=1 FL=1